MSFLGELGLYLRNALSVITQEPTHVFGYDSESQEFGKYAVFVKTDIPAGELALDTGNVEAHPTVLVTTPSLTPGVYGIEVFFDVEDLNSGSPSGNTSFDFNTTADGGEVSPTIDQNESYGDGIVAKYKISDNDYLSNMAYYFGMASQGGPINTTDFNGNRYRLWFKCHVLSTATISVNVADSSGTTNVFTIGEGRYIKARRLY